MDVRKSCFLETLVMLGTIQWAFRAILMTVCFIVYCNTVI